MGQSTDAILVCGVDFGDDLPEVFQKYMGDMDKEHFDFEDFLCHESGIFLEENSTKSQFDSWYKRRNEVRDACPVEMIFHCSGEYPMYILAVKGTETTAWRGDPKLLNLREVQDSLSFQSVGLFEKWCKDHEIEKSNPDWLLCSMWD